MELYVLNSNFRPEKPVETYESLIWTERYAECGDFELVSTDIDAARSLMPLESTVSLMDSTVPMIVEDHKITKPRDDVAKITITGRSFESVLDRRVSVGALSTSIKRPPWSIFANKSSDAAYKAIRTVIGDGTARSNLPALSPAVASQDAIPELNLPLPSDYSTGSTEEYEIPVNDLYSMVLELVQANHHGIRAVRPPQFSLSNKIDLEIYNGADLRDHVSFDAQFEQFVDATYLMSRRSSKNIAYVYGSNAGSIVRKTNLGPVPSGLARRVTAVDDQEAGGLSTPEVRTSAGLMELYKNNETALFDGETSAIIADLYNKPYSQGGYSLGDIILLIGEYGLTRNVRVAEFIRSSDTSGVAAYPTFEVVDD